MYSGGTLATRMIAGALVLGAMGAVVWNDPRSSQSLAPSALPVATTASTEGSQQSAMEVARLTPSPSEPTVPPASDHDEPLVDDRMTQSMRPSDPAVWVKKRIDRQITFDSTDVEGRVRTFDVDCDRGGATMRLMDVLRIMAREGTLNGLETWLRIEGRGDDIRVYRDLLKDGVPQLRTKVVMRLNKWDEIRLFGIHPDAIKIRCLLRDQRRL